jgi:hypothetical protein
MPWTRPRPIRSTDTSPSTPVTSHLYQFQVDRRSRRRLESGAGRSGQQERGHDENQASLLQHLSLHLYQALARLALDLPAGTKNKIMLRLATLALEGPEVWDWAAT